MSIEPGVTAGRLRALLMAAAMLLAAVLMRPGEAAAATGCPAPSHPPKVTVTQMLPAPLEDHTTSYHDLTKEMSWKKMKPEEDAMGVSSSNLGYEVQSQLKLVTHGGQTCVYLTSLDVQFGYTRRLVQIAAEVPERSCMYNEIKEHEYKHVAVDNGIVRDNFTTVTAKIQSFAATYKPMETSDSEAAKKALAQALKAELKPVLRHLDELANAAQEKVDTETEYKRVDNACRVVVDTSKPEPAAIVTSAPAAPSTPTPPSLKPGGK